MSEMQMGGGVLGRLQSRVVRLAGNVVWIVYRFFPWGLLVPVAVSLWIITQIRHPWWQFTDHEYQTIIASWVLGIGLVASASFWVLRGEFFHRWSILVTAYLMCREVQPEGLGPASYAAPILLLWHAAMNFRKMRPYVVHRLSITLGGGALLCFGASMACDFGWWSPLPGHSVWKINLRNTLDTMGHVMIVATIFGTEILWRLGRLVQDDAIGGDTMEFLPDSEGDATSSHRAA